MVRTPERRLRGHASFVLPHTDSSSATSGVHISSPTIPQYAADKRIQSSELSDLDLEPSFVVPASVTVVHPQLRDLISCPKERGVIYHVKGTSIVELTVETHSQGGEDDPRQPDNQKFGHRPLISKEWWCPSFHSQKISSLGFIPNCLTASANMLACGGQQGELHLTSLPPPPSDRWNASDRPALNPWRSRHLPAPGVEDANSAAWSMTVTLPHASINNSFVLLPPYGGDTPLPTRPGSPVEETNTSNGSIYQGRRDHSGTTPPVATFPNSLPRGSRAQRYSTRESSYTEGNATRTSSWSTRSGSQTDNSRQSSEGNPGGGDDGMSFLNTFIRASGAGGATGSFPNNHGADPEAVVHRDSAGNRPRVNRAFRGRTHSDGNRPGAGSNHGYDSRPPWSSHGPGGEVEPDVYVNDTGMTTFGAQTAAGSSHPYSRHPPPSWYSQLLDNSQFPQRPLPPPSSFLPQTITRSEPRLLVSNNDQFVKLFALRSSKPGGSGRPDSLWGERGGDSKVASKRLTNVGGVKINTAANHSSLSPDGRTMICVGDNHELYLYEVISGGTDFRLIRTYRASDDAGFSTSWSKDGKKFAVASQDGVVTVWDHRSSEPLAKLYTRTRHDFGRFDYEDSYYWRSAGSDGSRRDPARVVKFSPPGSSRDLLVFSEEGEAIHIVDARTFDVQARLELPIISREERIRNAHHASYSPTRRMGPDGGRVGVAGIAFDPTGDFLYAGTEAVMVEYDLRRHSRRGIGSWVMA